MRSRWRAYSASRPSRAFLVFFTHAGNALSAVTLYTLTPSASCSLTTMPAC